jgi:hypothetical protein
MGKKVSTAITGVYIILFISFPAFGQILIDDFEDVSDWRGLARDDTLAMEGSASGLWADTVATTSVRKDFDPPLDFSPYGIFAVWIYSHAANGAQMQLVLDSENEADPEGSDYYSRELTFDWEGWRYVRIPLADFGVSRNPLGWDTINSVALNASGWSHEPLPDTALNLDAMIVSNGAARIEAERYFWSAGDFIYEYDILVENLSAAGHDYDMSFFDDPAAIFEASVSPPSLTVPSGGTGAATASIRIPAALITPDRALQNELRMLVIYEDATPVDALTLRAAVPLPAREHPALLLDAADAVRINTWASAYSWAESRRDSVIDAADGWPADYEDKYGLGAWSLPPEGGQWSLWYVCPDDNVYLEYRGPGQHVCPRCGRTFTGWPYDQVIYGRMHNDLATAALRLGQAYLLTGDGAYAIDAGAVLLAYADQYASYPIHNVDGNESTSGARVLAQTLDESGWLIDMAWAYDLIRESGVLDDTERAHIEADLLGEAARVIGRNDAGESNWQSWHNAALGAVGFTLDDPRLQSDAWNGGSGFLFQMDASVSSDGFWYEGSWGYHFYALRALTYTAEMARRAGLDPFTATPFLSMFSAPVIFAEPDGMLPPFNDSGRSSLPSSRGLYESAYGWTSDPFLAVPLDPGSRPLEALWWGAETVESGEEAVLGSTIFSESGFVVMRTGMTGPSPLYLALDFGPHGGWHGHNDKLGFVLYALGQEAAVDPGTHSYALAIHDGYDRTTVAHNTVTVDEKSQEWATGALMGAVFLHDLALARAGGGEAYAEASLVRELFATDRYVIDRFEAASLDGSSHRYDWVLHGRGVMEDHGGAQSAYALPGGEGYGYLDDVMLADLALPARITWNYSGEAGAEAGSWWGSESGIDASFEVVCDRAAEGECSARMHYDFSSASGYIIYSLDPPEDVETLGAPTGLGLDLYGDGSGNSISLRLYDATDERFVFDAGSLDFSGWRRFDAASLETWSHYLGNEDGIFDPPVKTVSVQVGLETGGSAVSDIYVDSVSLAFGADTVSVADFEIERRFTNLYFPEDNGAGGLEIVTGTGPTSWSEAVPFVMLRKQGTGATFSALMHFSEAGSAAGGRLEPLAAGDCGAAACRGYTVTCDAFFDAALWDASFGPGSVSMAMTDAGGETFSTDGALGFCRSESDAWVRMAISAGAVLACRSTVLLEISAPAPSMQVDISGEGRRVDVLADLAVESQIRILAPAAESAFLNGAEVAYERDGDYIILSALPTVDEGEWPEGFEVPDWADASADAGGDAGDGGGSGGGCGCAMVR